MQIADCRRMTPELVESPAQSDSAIFIDAATETAPGEVVVARSADDAQPANLRRRLEPGGDPRRLWAQGMASDSAL
jgi:Ni,Fe-hydrogenase maturation factor